LNVVKKYLSYIFELPIEKKYSESSGTLEVTLHKGAYKLSTENAIYSWGKYYTSFGTAFRRLEIYHVDIPKVLILGYGLGSIADLLIQNKSVEEIIGVDSDPVIMDLAYRYQQINGRELVCISAVDYIQTAIKKFDLICIDIFIDDKVPAVIMQEDFLEKVFQRLNTNGWLIFSQLTQNILGNKLLALAFDKYDNTKIIFSEGNTLYCLRKGKNIDFNT
jgi:2-polyprenyl-3-methyl-5-hydroxy-6-metoxy-1,4-benzoquinol methylase